MVTREQKINFLLEGEKKLKIPYTETCGDFSTISDDDLNEMVEELDWLWK